jgi:methylated-DNA-[protein]-cysteine S-methyltransferase
MRTSFLDPNVTTAVVDSPLGTFAISGTEEGITHVHLPGILPTSTKRVAVPVRRGAKELSEYFAGKRKKFTVALVVPRSTLFQRSVWEALARVAYGERLTYGELSYEIGHPRAMRAVGSAAHVNPWAILVPCHRLVATTGLGGYGGGLVLKAALLDLESFHQ